MYRRRIRFHLNLLKPFVILLAGLAVLSGFPTWAPTLWQQELSPITHAAAQLPGDQDELKRLREELEGLDRLEDVTRRASFLNLMPYLPLGTRMTSGYRSPQQQLDLICRFARANKIVNQCNRPEVGRPESWEPALSELRGLGFAIASPTHTGHASAKVVFDMAGPDLEGIKEGCELAQKRRRVVFKEILLETRNRCVHVEIDSWPAESLTFGIKQSSGGEGGSPGLLSEDERRERLQQLLTLHESEPNHLKKIEYDRERKLLIDPSRIADIERLDEEITRHQQESDRLNGDKQKQAARIEVSGLMQRGELDAAEERASALIERYPEFAGEDLPRKIKMRRLVEAAIDAFVGSDCEKGDLLINEALAVSKDDQKALRIKEHIENCLSGHRTRRTLLIVLGLVLFAGLIVGAYFVFRPKNWVLEGVEGQCRGQVFPLDRGEIVIGALGPPDGEADIVICDKERKISRRHCLIVHNARHWYLRDESTNGTKLNGAEVENDCYVRLKDGDEISLADEETLLMKGV